MYIKFSPNDYVLRYRNGKLVARGIGLSFFFWERNTSVCAVPVSGTDFDFIFHETTQDFQQVTVQGQMTCKITDYERIASALDFTVNLHNGAHLDKPMEKLSKRLVNLAHVLVKSHIGGIGLTEALQASRALATKVQEQLLQSVECRNLGVTVTGFTVLSITANPETARALEAKTRENILKRSDDALYERRNAAIEQERKVKENELNTEISVEEKKRAIRETELQTKRMVLEGDTELKRIEVCSKTEQERIRVEAENELKKLEVCSKAEQERIQVEAEIELERKRQELAQLRLENARKDADAEAYRIGAIMEAYNKLSAEVLVALATLNMEPERMIAQAFNNLATNTGKIGTLNITPELLDCLKVRDRK